IGVMLLIGAFVLGQNTADPDVAENGAHVGGEQIVEALKDGSVHQGCRYRVDGPVQRNLTVPFGRQRSSDGAGFEMTKVGLCDE
ncbi:MAG: hypothetical protein GY701_11070, partial [Sulfitobacter sp.]|nr:hypothetical protein [Sulfitobacter sp.]